MKIYKTKEWGELIDGCRCYIIKQEGDNITIKLLETDLEYEGDIKNLVIIN